MYIGKFAALTGTTPKTIRFYESIGLIPEPSRKGNYRIYDHTYVETVKQIKRAQDLGFKLSEFKLLMQGVNIKRGLPASVIIKAISMKRDQINTEFKKLQRMDEQLLALQNELKNTDC
ncbi:MerR family transcriptional regulator [Thalassotalea sp. 1_MG-2023]|uniref:MerR family transcriptional regulator n=1 Tax=Thalassotalea sp. 1_MG-2023 TaxID=3062680 RepID=UPI0026E2DA03|nr:MerR family transcriptional regulator [Thalassotalea sp. 1_MG-2023]MDO6426979.1 MerR family transcriptional regulator [Thalassotalea sp. 1_MG-2023]